MTAISWLILGVGFIVLVVGLGSIIRSRGALKNLERLVNAADELNTILKVHD